MGFSQFHALPSGCAKSRETLTHKYLNTYGVFTKKEAKRRESYPVEIMAYRIDLCIEPVIAQIEAAPERANIHIKRYYYKERNWFCSLDNVKEIRLLLKFIIGENVTCEKFEKMKKYYIHEEKITWHVGLFGAHFEYKEPYARFIQLRDTGETRIYLRDVADLPANAKPFGDCYITVRNKRYSSVA